MLRHALLSALLLALVFPLTGCPRAASPDAEETQRPLRSLHEFAQTEDVILATRINLERFTETAQAWRAVGAWLDDPEFEALADAADDPIRALQQAFDLPNDLPSLERSEPIYLMLSSQGNDDFFHAALLGLPTVYEDWPNHLNVRILLPSQSPGALVEELQPWADSMIAGQDFAAARVYEGADWARIELALDLGGGESRDSGIAFLDGAGLDRIQGLPSSERRTTPALLAFRDDDAIVSAWARMDSLTYLGILEMLGIFGDQYEMVGPAGKPRFFLEGIPRLSEAAIVSDAMTAHFEDVAFTLGSAGERDATFDLVLSRTSRGVAARTTAPALSVAGFEVPNPFLSFSWQGELAATSGQTPLWMDLLETEEMEIQGGFMTSPQDFASTTFMGGFEAASSSILAFLQNPQATIANTLGEMEGMFSPRGVALQAFPMGEAAGFPAGAALTLLYPNTPELRAELEGLLTMAEMIIPLPFDARLAERGDGLLEINASVGTTLDKLVSSRSPMGLDDLSLSVDLAGLRDVLGTAGFDDQTADLDAIDGIHIRTGSAESYMALRFTVGADATAPPTLTGTDPVLTNPNQRCRTEMAAASYEHLRDLRTDAAGHVDRWAEAVQAIAADCVGSDRYLTRLISQRIELAKEIAAQVP